MKTKLFTAGMLVAVCLLVAFSHLVTPSHAQSRSRGRTDVLWMGLKPQMSDYFVTNTYGQQRIQLGMSVEWVSASENVTYATNLVGQPGAVAISWALDSGFSAQWLAQDKVLFTR